MTSLFDLGGKAAAVTGANTGIGQGIAIALAQAGADVIAIGRTAPDETRAAIEATGRRMVFIEADLRQGGVAGPVVDQAAAAFGRLDILINNAGIIRRSDAVDFTEADWDAVMDVNLKTAFFLCQAAGRLMLANGGGKIVNIASLLSFQGGIRVASYTASKHGIAGLTKLLANEWAARGVNVNAIAPGYFVTNNTEALRQDENRSRQILERIPAGRWGQPSDLGAAAVFLSSAAADYIHGAVIPVDGGWLAR
jgi:2-deoxy-D-gluconate 3-dehydrogenase